MPETKLQQLKVYLLKESVAEFEDAIKEGEEFTPYPVDPDLGIDGLVLVKPANPQSPGWLDFVAEGLARDDAAIVGRIRTASASALLLIKSAGRLFALTWGYGRSLLRPEVYVRDFGLKVVLNVVNPETVRSIDMRTVEEMTFLTRRQASRASDFSSFRLDTSHDLLRGVTGEPRDEYLATRIAGAEAVTLATRVTFADLAAKCAQMLDVYEQTTYQERFGFVDNLSVITDPEVVAALEDRLIADLKMGRVDTVHMAPAEPEDWENISGFTYSTAQRAPVFRDLDINDFLGVIDADRLSMSYLKGHYAYVRYREQETSYAKYSIFSCLVYELEEGDKLFVLSGGDWHEIQRDWANRIREQVDRIPTYEVELPDALEGETENEYNRRAAQALSCPFLDRQIVTLAPPYDRVEICDLLKDGKEFLHVKRKTESATLSHLFNQGLVSAELFLHDEEFREKAHQKLMEIEPELAAALPVQERPITSDYRIVYAVIAKRGARLPFFSQLTLANVATRLRQLGYGVSLRFIVQLA